MALINISIPLLFLISALASANSGVGVFFNLPRNGPGAYHGLVWSGAQVVQMRPELQAKTIGRVSNTGLVCGFLLHKNGSKHFPFVIQVIDKYSGVGEIRVKKHFVRSALLQPKYSFQLEAYDCDSTPHFSERVFVHLTVMKNQGPVFTKTHYSFPVSEGLPLGTVVGQVAVLPSAISKDSKTPTATSGKGNATVCNYTILLPSDAPFTVDRLGIIRTAAVLYALTRPTYEFHVLVEDCSRPQPRATAVQVSVDVYKACQPQWAGVPSRVTHPGGLDSPVLNVLGGAPRLELCGLPCAQPHVTATVVLSGEQLRPAAANLCRMMTGSVRRQRRLCDGSAVAVDLLSGDHQHRQEWDHATRTFHFDGLNSGWLVDPSLVPMAQRLGRVFSLTFWLRHGLMRATQEKEQVACSSDGEGMNRHHFAITLHNCKLILLLRRESDPQTSRTFAPSEWRWGPLNQLCRDPTHWHHYAVTYAAGGAALLVDGESVGVPEVISALPLHPTAPTVRTTRLAVGACYHSRAGGLAQRLQGQLAGLTLLRDAAEPVNVIRCMANCGESLLLANITELMYPAMSVDLLSDRVSMTGVGDNSTNNIAAVLARVTYASSETTDSSGIRAHQPQHRLLRMTTSVKCSQGSEISIPNVEVSLDSDHAGDKGRVGSLPPMQVHLEGRERIDATSSGVIHLFPDLHYRPVQLSGNSGHPGGKQQQAMFDSCMVRVIGPPLPRGRHLVWPHHAVRQAGLQVVSNSHGLDIDGTVPLLADRYVTILRRVGYQQEGAALANVIEFSLTCSQMKGQVNTNELVVKLIPQAQTQHQQQAPGVESVSLVEDPLHAGPSAGANSPLTKHTGKKGPPVALAQGQPAVQKSPRAGLSDKPPKRAPRPLPPVPRTKTSIKGSSYADGNRTPLPLIAVIVIAVVLVAICVVGAIYAKKYITWIRKRERQPPTGSVALVNVINNPNEMHPFGNAEAEIALNPNHENGDNGNCIHSDEDQSKML